MTGPRDNTLRRLATDKEQIKLLNDILNNNKLKDAYKRKRRGHIETTHYSIPHNNSTRLDRIYTQENTQVHKLKHLAQTLSFTDHKAVVAHINNTPRSKEAQDTGN